MPQGTADGYSVHVAGPALIKVNAGTVLEGLGYTRNGADVRFEGHFQNVPGDENGGDEGPPVEIVFLGETARARIELTRWNATVADKVAARVKGATAGTPSAAGTLMFGNGVGNSKTTRVCIASTITPMNFPRCVCSEPIEINKGTRFSTLIFEFVAYKDETGVLYNATIT